MELIRQLASIGASVATPLALAGFGIALAFGGMYRVVSVVPAEKLGGSSVRRILVNAMLFMFVLGIVAILSGLGAWLADRYWLKGDLVAEYIDGARSALEKGDSQGALSFTRRGLETVPGHSELLNLEGYAYMLQERYERARDRFRQAYATRADPRYLYNSASAATYLGQHEEALADFERAAATQPPDARYQIFHGVLLAFNGKYDAARRKIEPMTSRSYSKFDLRPLAFFELGVVTVLQNGPDHVGEATRHFRKSVCLDEAFANLYRGFSDLVKGDTIERFTVELEEIKRVFGDPTYEVFLDELPELRRGIGCQELLNS